MKFKSSDPNPVRWPTQIDCQIDYKPRIPPAKSILSNHFASLHIPSDLVKSENTLALDLHEYPTEKSVTRTAELKGSDESCIHSPPAAGWYKCSDDSCKAVFRSFTSLKKHQLVHDPPGRHKCEHKNCTAAFRYSRALKRHQLVHQGLTDPTFACHEAGCGAIYHRRDNLLRHRLNKHPEPTLVLDTGTAASRFDNSSPADSHLLVKASIPSNVNDGDRLDQMFNAEMSSFYGSVDPFYLQRPGTPWRSEQPPVGHFSPTAENQLVQMRTHAGSIHVELPARANHQRKANTTCIDEATARQPVHDERDESVPPRDYLDDDGATPQLTNRLGVRRNSAIQSPQELEIHHKSTKQLENGATRQESLVMEFGGSRDDFDLAQNPNYTLDPTQCRPEIPSTMPVPASQILDRHKSCISPDPEFRSYRAATPQTKRATAAKDREDVELSDMPGSSDIAQDVTSLPDSPHYNFETLSTTPESASHFYERRDPFMRRIQRLEARYADLKENGDYDSTSDSDTDSDSSDDKDNASADRIDAGHSACNPASLGEQRTENSDSPDSSNSNNSDSQRSFHGHQQHGTRQAGGNARHNQDTSSEPSNGNTSTKGARAVERAQNNSDDAGVIPCPLSSLIDCPGKSQHMADME